MGYTGEDKEEVSGLDFDMPWRDIDKKPWEIRDDEPAPQVRSPKKKGNVPVQKVISGIGIEETPEVDVKKNDELLNNLNKSSLENLEEEEEKIRLARQKEEEEAERYRQDQTKKVLLERYEQEQREKAEREAREAQEAARLAAELEEKRQNSFLFKLKGSIESKFEQMKENSKQKAASKAEEKERMKEEAESLKEETKKEKEKAPKEKTIKPIPKKKEKAKPVKVAVSAVDKTDYKYIATHDPITGFMNKVALEEAKAPYKSTGIIYLFVPEFEIIRGKGEEAETAVLKHLSGLVESNLGENVYYLGNGAFVALVKKEDAEGLLMTASSFRGKIPGVNYVTFAGMSAWEGNLGDSIESAKQEAISKRNEQNAKDGKGSKKDGKVLEYDALLTKEQRNLKITVRENHESVSRDKTKNIIGEIRARASEILAVMMTDDKFDTLFIIRDVRTFLSLVNDMDFQLDYSYLYILYQGGPQYFGNDEYYSDITKLFDTISEGLRTGNTKTTKDIQKIRGINIFKHIYFQ